MRRRKPRAARKESEIRVRVTVAQKRLLTVAAERADLGVSSWLRKVGLQAARSRAIKETV